MDYIAGLQIFVAKSLDMATSPQVRVVQRCTQSLLNMSVRLSSQRVAKNVDFVHVGSLSHALPFRRCTFDKDLLQVKKAKQMF